jgi:TonB family protein
MALRCLLFCSQQETADSICRVLADLEVEAERCVDAAAATERVSSQPFRIVIVDWDQQPEAGDLLHTARGRKPSERPLTLAIVSDDVSVPKALQAGANSILRRPLLANQMKDTLTTARDLLRARESTASAALAVAAGAGSSATTMPSVSSEATLRAGEFLQTTAPASTTQFDTESEMQKSIERSAAREVDLLKDLEPMAAVIEERPAPPPPPPSPDEPRGLQWYLNQRAGAAVAAPAPQAPPAAPAKPELIGFDQPPVSSATELAKPDDSVRPLHPPSAPHAEQGRKAEAELFSYIAEEKDEPENQKNERPRVHLGKGVIVAALVVAACAVGAAPQAPWHPEVRAMWGKSQHAVHAWLNPQPVTPVQAPVAHEDFGRAGDEYKLPVAENIPDATTDPSQIRVVPVVDPTAKKPNNGGANPDPNLAPVDGSAANPPDATTAPAGQTPQGQSPAPGDSTPDNSTQGNPPSHAPASTPAAIAPPTGSSAPAATNPAVAEPPHSDPFTQSPTAFVPPRPVAPKNPPPRPASTSSSNPPIPSSLKSQMASMVPDQSGNKAPESALPSIEPVDIPEATERALLTDQPAMPYPASAKAQQGTVVLQVLIGRDGSVQDAKFMQGSLAFARTAIDGVKQWKFKPYTMNGRPVSVQTLLTISFKPGQ